MDAVVLGAGLSGLSYALRILRSGGSVIVLEKEGDVGGLAKSYFIDGFVFDFGPHIFRSKDERVLDFVKDLLGGNYHDVFSNPAIFKYGRYFDNVIPVITWRSIELLPKEKRERVLSEMKGLGAFGGSNFEECVRSQVGETLYWEFFGEYSRKWWGVEPRLLSCDIAPRNLKIGEEKSYAHITTNFEKPGEEIYPTRGGIFEIARRLYQRVVEMGGVVHTRSTVKGFEQSGGEITHVVVDRDGEEVEIDVRGKEVVSTIPLSTLADMLKVGHNLIYRGDACVMVKLRGDPVLHYSWVYFHDSDVLFGRLYEPVYYSRFNAPQGYTSLCVEVTYFRGDSIDQDRFLGDKVLEQLIDLGIVKRSQDPQILGVVKEPYAYPLPTVDYKRRVADVVEKLRFSNLKIIGRTGSFSYLNMWQCLQWAVY